MRWSVFLAAFVTLVVGCVGSVFLLPQNGVNGTVFFALPIALAAVAGGLALAGRGREGEAVVAGGLAATVLMVLSFVAVSSFLLPWD